MLCLECIKKVFIEYNAAAGNSNQNNYYTDPPSVEAIEAITLSRSDMPDDC